MSVGVADCHKMHTLLVRLVHRQDAFRRKSMDCRDHGCSHQCGKRMRGKIRLIVDYVEAIGPFEQVSKVSVFPDLRVDGWVLALGSGDNAI